MANFILGFAIGAVAISIVAVILFKQLLNASKLNFQQSVEDNSKKLADYNSETLGHILNPLKERISEYQKQVEETYSKESRERFHLQKEVERLSELSRMMEKETQALSQALKGDVKVQGNWGEVILDKVLESSGLTQGREYELQNHLKDRDGNAFRPDAIIYLPNDSHIVIDSKASLTHYAEYLEAVAEEKEEVAKKLKRSFSSHIDGLSHKAYQNLEGIKSPDFVFMFIPIEGAFLVLLKTFPEMLEYAWKKNIVLVTPSTLMSNLRTMASIWRLEKQSQNAEMIAHKAGLLYDKFVGLLNDLQKVEEHFKKTGDFMDKAFNKLKTGKGNLIDKSEELKSLGAKSTKEIPQTFINQ